MMKCLSILTKKNSLLTLLMALCMQVFAQAPEGITYQAAVRDGSGNLVANQNVDLKFTIKEGTTSIYSEEHLSVSTNAQGLVSVVIGDGTVLSGSFSSIDWMNSMQEELEVEVDLGSGYVSVGTQNFESVPYALNSSPQIFERDSSGISYSDTSSNSSERVFISTSTLSSNDDLLTLSRSALGPSDAQFIEFQYPGFIFPFTPITVAAINTDGSADFQNVELTDTAGSVNAPDAGTMYEDNAPMAWGYINGTTGSLTNNFGISSVTRNSAGEYTVTLDNSWTDSPAVVVTPITASGPAEIPGVDPLLTSGNAIDVNIYDAANTSTKVDSDFMIIVFGRPQ